ncbi:unnamed protein product, partial [Clonostachys rosea]
ADPAPEQPAEAPPPAEEPKTEDGPNADPEPATAAAAAAPEAAPAPEEVGGQGQEEAVQEQEPAPEEEKAAEQVIDPNVVLVVTLKERNSELETRNNELQEKAAAVDALASERDNLCTKLAEAEKEAQAVPDLRVENGTLAAKLEEVKGQLETEKQAHQAASNEVTALQKKVSDLTKKLGSKDSSEPRGRAKAKGDRKSKRDNEIVIVRCPREGSRGISIVRRKNLHHVRSSSQSDGSGLDN